MPRAGRKATAALLAALAMMVMGRASADESMAATDQGEATIALHVANYAELSRDVLDEAKSRVASVYRVIGVSTVWIEGEKTLRQGQDGQLYLTVLLLSRDMTEKKTSAEGINSDLLGQAHLPSGRAYIFCDRIATMPGAPAHFPIPLGDVIAHEVGHLVLRTNSHSPRGIMRANVDVHTIHLQSFDKTQARTIRTRLIELTAGATGR
jgi:hypothetical protein